MYSVLGRVAGRLDSAPSVNTRATDWIPVLTSTDISVHATPAPTAICAPVNSRMVGSVTSLEQAKRTAAMVVPTSAHDSCCVAIFI